VTAVLPPLDLGTPGLFLRDDYYDVLATLRRESPVHRSAPDAWAVSRYADIRDVSRDPERFCSSRGVLVNDPLRTGATVTASILHMDPPDHPVWRQLVSRPFTPRAVAGLEDRIRTIARDVLDAAPIGTPIDLVDAVTAPFPVLVIAELLGIGDGDRDAFRRSSNAAIAHPDDPGVGHDDLVALHRFLIEHVRARRAEPRDDIVSALVTADIDGARAERRAAGAGAKGGMSTADVVGYCFTLLVAGNETTRHLVSGSALALWEHPDQRALLAAEPERIGAAVEECLRWVTPIQVFGRTATRDLTLHGEHIPEGDFVALLYASGNRDEAAFGPTADRFDVTRTPDAQHVAFGFGPHLCLGAALARLEARVMLEELLARFPAYDVVGDPEWTPSTLVRGLARLPVTLRAR
jgi:cytochrome P450